ncbi:hypothetical protein [Reyranella sp.]|uniref:hypothetical protein n=1 Tax=Reyranella sp. TaxID=1929291 RepID=UPI003D152B6C
MGSSRRGWLCAKGHILQGIATEAIIPAIAVRRIFDEGSRFSHQLYDGFHRFSASLAIGFTHIPVEPGI